MTRTTISRMGGRPTNYSPEEDAIILRERSTDEVLRLFKEAGYEERSPAAITSRRALLREHGSDRLSELDVDDEEAIPLLVGRRRKLSEQLDSLTCRVREVEKEIETVNAQLRAAIDRVTSP